MRCAHHSSVSLSVGHGTSPAQRFPMPHSPPGFTIMRQTPFSPRLHFPPITIVVPNGYRGPLLVEYRPVDRWLQGNVRQREFTYCANEKGYVGIDATPLLLTIRREMRVRYANGDDIPEWNGGLGDDDVALRWVESNGTQMIYVVGTKSDEEILPPPVYNYYTLNTRATNQDAVNRLFREAASSPE